MMTPGDDREDKMKNRFQKLVDWVNADEDFPKTEDSVPQKEDTSAGHSTPEPSYCEPSVDDCPIYTDLDATTEDYEGDNEFEYPDEVSHEDLEDFDQDYVAGDETLCAAPHEALHLTKQQKKQMGRFRLFYLVLSAIVALNLIVLLLLTVSYLPEFGTVDRPSVNEVYIRYADQGLADTGALNLVAGVLFSYRSFDTLGEAFVLFTAIIAVMILMQKPKDDDAKEDNVKEGH